MARQKRCAASKGSPSPVCITMRQTSSIRPFSSTASAPQEMSAVFPDLPPAEAGRPGLHTEALRFSLGIRQKVPWHDLGFIRLVPRERAIAALPLIGQNFCAVHKGYRPEKFDPPNGFSVRADAKHTAARADRRLKRAVVRIGKTRNVRFAPVSGVRKQTVARVMLALIGLRIRISAALDQRQPHHAVVNGVAVLVVVQKRHAVTGLGIIRPLLRTDLKFGRIPRSILMRRTFDRTILDLISRLVRKDVHRESRL